MSDTSRKCSSLFIPEVVEQRLTDGCGSTCYLDGHFITGTVHGARTQAFLAVHKYLHVVVADEYLQADPVLSGESVFLVVEHLAVGTIIEPADRDLLIGRTESQPSVKERYLGAVPRKLNASNNSHYGGEETHRRPC